MILDVKISLSLYSSVELNAPPGELNLVRVKSGNQIRSVRLVRMEVAIKNDSEDLVAATLRTLEEQNGKEFWSFKGTSKRVGAHTLIQYPAMMVPSLQGCLIDTILTHSNINSMLDPFVGSGTTLTEAMARGIDFTGVDINPLAGLSCLVKSGPYFTDALKDKSEQLYNVILSKSRSGRIKVRSFPGVDKWFHKSTSVDLEVISRSISEEPSKWARRVFWLALSRTVRKVSNSRLSTYKLHKRPDVDLSLYRDAKTSFKDEVLYIIEGMAEQKDRFDELGVVSKGRCTKRTTIIVGNSSQEVSKLDNQFDLVMTSPPYGDNHTTIPYGQYSYLPLKWIDIFDITPDLDAGLIRNTHSIDHRSLGGSLKGAKEKMEYLGDCFSSAKLFLDEIKGNVNGKKRFSVFYYDLQESIKVLCEKTKSGGYHSWTVGSRRIGGVQLPMKRLVEEALGKGGVSSIASISREINHKKMAFKNNFSETMGQEDIILAKKD